MTGLKGVAVLPLASPAVLEQSQGALPKIGAGRGSICTAARLHVQWEVNTGGPGDSGWSLGLGSSGRA